MKGVLVDTSVWVDHFRHHNAALVHLLGLELVAGHPWIVAEIACGSPPERLKTLSDLDELQQIQQATIREVRAFIEREQLFGLGCGLVELVLLASALMTPGVELWSLDRRLCALADRFGVMHRPTFH